VHYRLTAPSGRVLEEGEGEARVLGGALTVTPEAGQLLRLRASDVTEIGEPQPYVVRLVLAEGPTLELSRLGALRTQLLSDFGTVRKADTVAASLAAGIGSPLTFPGVVDDVEAEVRLYDDRLLVVPVAGDPRPVRYSFVDDVHADESGYRITVAAGAQTLQVSRLAQRTSEFLTTLRERMDRARTRSAALIESLLPGLGGLAQRSVAGLLRDGVPARATELDAAERSVSASLVRTAALDERRAGLAELAAQGELWLAIYQRGSVEVAATGGADLRARRIAVATDHRPASPYGSGGGFGAMIAADLLGGPDQTSAWGAGPFGPAIYDGFVGGPTPRARPPRREPRTGASDVPHTDFGALTVRGIDPSVLVTAFVVLPAERAIVHEVLNDGGVDTYVYDIGAGGAVEAVHTIASGLALIGYRLDVVDADAISADSSYVAAARSPHVAELRTRLRGRAAHGDQWHPQLAALLD
jgi:hypothetical protein